MIVCRQQHLHGLVLLAMASTLFTCSTGYEVVTSVDYTKTGGCAAVHVGMCQPSNDEVQRTCRESKNVRAILDKCGSCRTCPQFENEPCGGPYYIYGSCSESSTLEKKEIPYDLYCINNGKLVPNGELMKGINITGICQRKSCYKDCLKSSTRPAWVCGSDHKWRYNICFFRKERNCNPQGSERLYRVTIDPEAPSNCGPKPTATTYFPPVPSSTSSRIPTSTSSLAQTSTSTSSFSSSSSSMLTTETVLLLLSETPAPSVTTNRS